VFPVTEPRGARAQAGWDPAIEASRLPSGGDGDPAATASPDRSRRTEPADEVGNWRHVK